MSILVFGAVFVDYKGFPFDKFIPAGRNAGMVEITHGGVGRNIAEDIANAGFGSAFVSIVDNNVLGDEVLSKLHRSGVNTDYILRRPDAMGAWLAVFDESGDIVASISKRPEISELSLLLGEKGDEMFYNSDGIVVEIDMDEETLKRILSLAKRYNKPVYACVANISIASQRKELLRQLDCFICNEQEADILFGCDLTVLEAEQLCEALSSYVVSAEIPAMIVTLGSRGSAYADARGAKYYYPCEEVSVCDTTGAGDAFCAGIAIGMSYSKDITKALSMGTHLATSVVTSTSNVCSRFNRAELGFEG